MRSEYRKLRKGTVDLKQFKDDVPDNKIKEVIDDEVWDEMLKLFEESLRVGSEYPVKAFMLQKEIVQKAKPYLGNAAKYVLRALRKDLVGGK